MQPVPLPSGPTPIRHGLAGRAARAVLSIVLALGLVATATPAVADSVAESSETGAGAPLSAAGPQPPCAGRNLIAGMPPERQEALRARAALQPFAEGNLWTARRDGAVVHLLGTYHLDDPRHDATMERVRPLVASVATVLVEAGPDEEKALRDRIAADPSLMMVTEGPTLIDRMPPDQWQALTALMQERGLPPFMAAKFQPWYLTLLLSIPACAMPDSAGTNGLDARVIDAALAAGRPLRALEPPDTLFTIFGGMTDAEEIGMVLSTLALAPMAEDMSRTLADAYFAEENRLIWELTVDMSLERPGADPEQVQQEMAAMEAAMMTRRNAAWVPVIEKAALDGPVLAAFGALHLSGAEGVLALMEARGWTIERQEFR